MKRTNNFRLGQEIKGAQQPSELDLMVFLPLIIKKWYWFLITMVIALFFARFYISHTMPLYRSSVSVLVNETDDRPIVDNTQLLLGLGLPGGMKNLHNQIAILESRTLIEKTLEELPFEIEFYFKTIKNKLPIYPERPLVIIADKEVTLPKDVEFLISIHGNDLYTLESNCDYYNK